MAWAGVSVQFLMLFCGTVPFLVSFALSLTFAITLIHLPHQNSINKTCRGEGIGTNHLYFEYVSSSAVDYVLNGTWVADQVLFISTFTLLFIII